MAIAFLPLRGTRDIFSLTFMPRDILPRHSCPGGVERVKAKEENNAPGAKAFSA